MVESSVPMRPLRGRAAPAGAVLADQPVEAHDAQLGVVPLPTSRLGRVVAAPIVAYRRWISPVLPPTCRFYPSCSEYALRALTVHGPLRGVGLTIWRLLRCHPFHPGGIDHVPPRRHRHDDVTAAASEPTARL